MQGDACFWEAYRKSSLLPKPITTKHTFDELNNINTTNKNISVELIQYTTLDAVKFYKDQDRSQIIAIHNFANGLAPCANMVVSNTQEENLFRNTNLSTTLTNDFYPLNLDSLLSKDVIILDTYSVIDVISSAAIDTPIVYNGEWGYYNSDYHTTKTILSTTLLLANKYDIFITGAWGCGLFANPMPNMCELWNELIPLYGGKKIVFAIPDDRTYNIFKQYIKTY